MGALTFELAEKLLNNLKNRGFTSAIFGGGEPFYWPHDFKKILKHAKSLGLTTQVGTNATKLPRDFTEWDFVDRWVIPIDGIKSETHNELRTFQNRHWEIVTDTLAQLKKAGRSCTISTVITQVNQNEIPEFGEYLRILQNPDGSFLHAWHLYKFLPFGRGGKPNQNKLEIPDSDYEKIVNDIRKKELPFKVFKRKDMLLSKTVEFFWVEDGKLFAQSRAKGKRLIEL